MIRKLAFIFVVAFAIIPSAASASVSLGEANLNVLSSGLVGYWSLDGNSINWSTGAVSDLSGSGNTGALVGMSTTSSPTTGKIGQALLFNGLTSYTYVNLGSSSTLNPAQFTIAAWVKPNNVSSSYNWIYSNSRDCCGSPYNGVGLQIGSGGALGGVIWNSTPTYINGASLAKANTWTYAVFTYDGSNMRLYFNGKLDATQAYAGGVGTPASFSSMIGTLGFGAGQYTFLGAIDDVRVYNRALSAAEIQMLYMAGSFQAGNTPAANSSFSIAQGGLNGGLVAYWPLDGDTTNWATGATKDISGNAYNGQLSNFSTSTSPVAGKIGQALSFNGSNTYVTTGYTIPAQSSATSFTWSAWVYLSVAGGTPVILGNRGGGGANWIKLTPSGFEYNGVVVSYTLPTGKWEFVTAIKNGSNFTYYLNGTVVGTGTNSGSSSSYAFYMGEDPGYTGDGDMSGKLDDVRVYSRALSQQEVQQLYASGQLNIGHSSTNASVGLSAGLAGYWTFDGPTVNWATGVVKDSSGSGNSGLMVGLSTTTSPVVGKVGQAMSFTGASYVDVPITLSPSAFTVSTWFRPTSLSGSGTGNSRIVANSHTDSDDKGFQLMFNSGGASGFFDVGNGTAECRVTWTKQLVAGQWYYYVGVYTGASAIVYLNGVQVAATTGCSGAMAASGNDLNIGRDPAYGPQDYFIGSVDDVRVYTRALSQQEISQLYAADR